MSLLAVYLLADLEGLGEFQTKFNLCWQLSFVQMLGGDNFIAYIYNLMHLTLQVDFAQKTTKINRDYYRIVNCLSSLLRSLILPAWLLCGLCSPISNGSSDVMCQPVTDQIRWYIGMSCINNSIYCLEKKMTLGTHDQTCYVTQSNKISH